MVGNNSLIIRNEVSLHVMDFTHPAIFYLPNHILILQSGTMITNPSGVRIDLWLTLKDTVMEKD